MFKILLISFISTFVHAQDIGVKVNSINSDQDTTISIKKGDSAIKKKYTISEGQEELSGDKDVLKKTAEKNWRKACDLWKSELKENNKESQQEEVRFLSESKGRNQFGFDLLFFCGVSS